MRKGKLRLRVCGKIILIAILLNFLTMFPVFAEPVTEPLQNSTEGLMRYYSEMELTLLIEEIREAAHEVIEQAAGEAARAAMLSMLEREAAALREAARWRVEAQNNLLGMQAAKNTGRKNAFIGTVIGIFGGLVLGISGTLIIGGR